MKTLPTYTHASISSYYKALKKNTKYIISFLNNDSYQDCILFHTMSHLNTTGADKFSSDVVHYLKSVL